MKRFSVPTFFSTFAAAAAVAVTATFAFAQNAAPAEGAAEQAEEAPPYLLQTCPIGGPLGSMGEPKVAVIDGREVRFCCGGCEPAFRKDPAGSFAKMDRMLADQQRPTYPLDTCPVSAEKLGEDAVEIIHENRLVRLCCPNCEQGLREIADEHFATIDEAVIAQQLQDYPLETCPVSGDELSAPGMGEPANVVLGTQLVRICCEGCEDDLKANAPMHLQKLKAVRDAEAPAAQPEASPTGHSHGHGGHGHGGHGHGHGGHGH